MFRGREALATTPAHDLALDCLQAGIEAARPERAVKRHCSLEGEALRIRGATYDLSAYDEILVLGGGKAADALAAALSELLGDRLAGGAVVTHDPTADPRNVTVHEGEHPTPGDGSVVGTAAVLERAEAAGEGTLVLAAITGGGSALLCAPAAGLTVEDIRTATDRLLRAGASIDETNTVRRACSKIKGGGLAAAAAPATVVGLLVSDVVGDSPEVIASGPTVPVGTDPAAAISVLDRYDVDVPRVREWLRDRPAEKAADVAADNHVIASNRDAIDAARETAADRGWETCVLSTRIEGEAREAGGFHAAIAGEISDVGDPISPPAVVLSGGETTVAVTGGGVGGPNLEFTLAAASAIPDRVVVGAVDTDGSDGSTDAAGALADAGTVSNTTAAQAALDGNDSYRFFEDCGALLHTGPTGTNVNDLRIIVVEE